MPRSPGGPDQKYLLPEISAFDEAARGDSLVETYRDYLWHHKE